MYISGGKGFELKLLAYTRFDGFPSTLLLVLITYRGFGCPNFRITKHTTLAVLFHKLQNIDKLSIFSLKLIPFDDKYFGIFFNYLSLNFEYM